MIKTRQGANGCKFIRGVITLTIDAHVDDDLLEISEEDAMNLLLKEQDNLSGSNDGSELIANANIKLIP